MTRRNRLLAYVTRRQCVRRNRNLLSSLLKTQENNNNNYYHNHYSKGLLSSSCFTKTQPWTGHSLFLSPPLIPVSGLFQPEGALCKLLPLEHTYGASHYYKNELLSNSRAVLSSMHSISSHELNTFILATLGLVDDIDTDNYKGVYSVNLPHCSNNNNIDESRSDDKTQHDVSVCVDEKANVFTSPLPNATSSSSSSSSSTSPVLHMQRRFITNNNNNNNNDNSDSGSHSSESEQTESTMDVEMKENNHTEGKDVNQKEESDVAEEVSLPDVYAIISSCKLLNLVSANGEARLDWELPELKAKYRDLAQHYHPDLTDGCAVSMEQINNAYALLRHMSLMQKRELASAMRFGESYVLSRYDTSNEFDNDNTTDNDNRSRENNEINSTSNSANVTQEQESHSIGMFSKCKRKWFASHQLPKFFPWSSTSSTINNSKKTHLVKSHTPISSELLSDDMLALMAVGLYSTLLTLLWCVYYLYYHIEQWEVVKRAFTSWVSAQSGNKEKYDCSIDYSNNNTNHNVNDNVVENGMNDNPEIGDVHHVQETMHTSQTAKQNDKDHYYYNYYYHYLISGGKTNCTDHESAQNEGNNEKLMHQTSSNTKANASSSSSSSSSRLQRKPNKASTRQTNVSNEDSSVVNDINADVDILMAVRMLIHACQRS